MFTATIPVDTYPVMILLLLTGVIFLVAGFLLYKETSRNYKQPLRLPFGICDEVSRSLGFCPEKRR